MKGRLGLHTPRSVSGGLPSGHRPLSGLQSDPEAHRLPGFLSCRTLLPFARSVSGCELCSRVSYPYREKKIAPRFASAVWARLLGILLASSPFPCPRGPGVCGSACCLCCRLWGILRRVWGGSQRGAGGAPVPSWGLPELVGAGVRVAPGGGD